MREPQFAIAITAAVFTISFVTGCGSQPKEDTVSIIDENHFEQLASTAEDGQGNAAAAVEILPSAPAGYEQSAVTAASQVPVIHSVTPAAAEVPAAVQAQADAAVSAAAQAPVQIDSKIASFNQKVQT